MKRAFIITMIFAAAAACLGVPAQAADAPTRTQANLGKTMSKPTYVQDYQAISAILNSYIEGCRQADSRIMQAAFSPQATMYSVTLDGKLTGGAITILFEGVDKHFRPSPDAQAAITRIEIVGTAASARIDANGMSGLAFTDFFQLLKVDGRWTVISKVFHTHAAP